MKFIVDHNVGKLAKWLRMMGYDTLFFTGDDDWQMIITALNEGRVILTRDTALMKMGVIASGRLKAVLIHSDKPEEQIRQVVDTLDLDYNSGFFTVCLECNRLLEKRTRQQVKDRVPPYVFKTQKSYMECPSCHRIYWKGTHWQAMTRKIENLMEDSAGIIQKSVSGGGSKDENRR
jgi:uncharacterized protein with PIN domain